MDTNPVDVEVDGLSLVYADAGGNALNKVNVLGRISNLALFPNRDVTTPFPFQGMQAVPTSVEVGKDGNYYVSQLTGFPFPVEGASVYKVSSRGGTPQPIAGGFTMIMDMAFAKDGTLYVLEHDSTASCSRATTARSGPSRRTAPSASWPCPPGRCCTPAASRSVTTAST